MRQKKHLTFFILYFLIPFIQLNGQNLKSESIVGEWDIYSFHGSCRYIFYQNKDYKEFCDSFDLFKSWGGVRFEVVVKNDTTWLITTFKRANINGRWVRNYTDRRVFWLNGDYLTWALYKKGGGINNHIDEYNVLVRKTESPQRIEPNWSRINYIFPDSFKGGAWIAFGQPNGVPPTYDSLGNPILKIPENGLLLTTLHEDVFATANGYYNIVKENSKVHYKSYDKLASIDSTCCNPDSLLAFMGGFNQTSREDISNNIFRKPIQGNVMTIYIGKYKWFEKNWLHPWDSKME